MAYTLNGSNATATLNSNDATVRLNNVIVYEPIPPVSVPTVTLNDAFTCDQITINVKNNDSQTVTIYIYNWNEGTLAAGATKSYTIPGSQGMSYNIQVRAYRDGVYSESTYLSGTKPSFCIPPL